MEYKVVPFTAVLSHQKLDTGVVSDQLDKVITQYTDLGWEYVRLESVSTYIQPDAGCFGLGGKPGYMAAYQMIVFSRD